MAVSESIQDELSRIKKNISQSYLYFKDNAKRFHEFKNYIFNTSINDDQKALLAQQSKPIIEFNILEAYISRMLGEFSKQEPSIEVTPSEGIPVGTEVIKIVEGHIRHIVYEANKNNMSYEVYKDLLAGGYSVIKVWTDYANSMSMKQIIKTERCFDPTMCGFDPMARFSHKGDGNYSFEIFPMTEEDFKRKYPNTDASKFNYYRNLEEFTWTYKNEKGVSTILVGEYYEKKKIRTRIVELADGIVIPVSAYKKLPEFWQQQGYIEQIPVVVGKPRWTELETICRYEVCENEVLAYEETDYQYLPHIFIDGNSEILRQGTSNCTYQMTRPYVYQAKGAQELKNFSGQALANYIENLSQHKFIVMKESLPQEEDYEQALTDMQHANTIVLNAYSENNPDKPIPNPIIPVQNMPAPPEVMGAFQTIDPTVQSILGSYASNLGKNDNDLSGKAVIESASVGNSAGMPYIVGYLQGWTHMGNVIADLIPKYIKGKREIPVVAMNGKKDYQKINDKNYPWLRYQQNALNVCISAGVNFQVQKNQALQQISILMGISQEFNQFMNSPRGLPILVKNLTIYGADELKEAVPQYIQEQQEQQKQQQQQAQQMQQQAMQNNPRMIKAQADIQKTQLQAQEMQMKGQQQQFDNQITIAKAATEDKLADAKILEAEARISQAQVDSAIKIEESNTSLERHALDAAAKIAEVKGREHDMALKTHQAIINERK